jgi:hypothetical protein
LVQPGEGKEDKTSARSPLGSNLHSLGFALEGRGNVSEHESQLAEVEIGRCHICALLLGTEEDLLTHLKEAHGVKSVLQPPPA